MARTPTKLPDRTAHSAAGPGTAARAAGSEPRRKRRLGWLWWLLGLLALAAVAALLAGLLGGDEDGERAAESGAQSSQSGGDRTAGGAGTGAAGDLAAGDVKLLPVPSGGLAESVGQTARGREVVVQSVVRGDEPDALAGFWVGSSEQDRVYVEWGGDVGPDEAAYLPEVGEKVNLTGPVQPAPRDPQQRLNIDAADAELVRSQGGFVNADEVTPAGG